MGGGGLFLSAKPDLAGLRKEREKKRERMKRRKKKRVGRKEGRFWGMAQPCSSHPPQEKWGWQVRVCPEDVSILTPFTSVITALQMNPLLCCTDKKLKHTNLRGGGGLFLPPGSWKGVLYVTLSFTFLCRPLKLEGVFPNKIMQQTSVDKKMTTVCCHPPAQWSRRRCHCLVTSARRHSPASR